LRGASPGAAVHAGNDVGEAGAASLGPSLGRMTQLTSLDLRCTLHAIGGSWRCERVLASAGCAWMVCIAGGVVALGAVAGGGACEGRAEWRRCVQAMSSVKLGQHRWHRVSEG
jgi:hypothetical protein